MTQKVGSLSLPRGICNTGGLPSSGLVSGPVLASSRIWGVGYQMENQLHLSSKMKIIIFLK